MILVSILLTLIIIIASVLHARKSYNPETEMISFKGILIGLVLIIVVWFQPFTITRIDSGYKGIKVSLAGSQRGVQKYQYKTGWVMYNSWTEQVLEFPMFQQHIEYGTGQVITKGGFPADINPTFSYTLNEDVGDMFVNLRLDIKDIEQRWLKTAVVGAVNDVSNRWEVDSIFNDRQGFERAVTVECNKRVSKWFNISQLRTNIIPPEALQEAIISKTKAIQQAEAERQKAKTAFAEAQKKIAIAKGDSAQAVIAASGEALATKLKQQQLTPIYIEYMKAKKWDGKLPQTTVGSGANTMLNLR